MASINGLTAAFDEAWAEEFQEVFLDENIARQVADTQFEAVLVHGDVLHRPYTDDVSVQDVERDVDMTIDAVNVTDEQMTIQFERGTLRTLHKFDVTQSNFDIATRYAKLTAEALSRQVDADVLGEVVNADTVLDAGNFGGTAGTGIAVTTSNVQQIYSRVITELGALNVTESDRIAVISYNMAEQVNNLISATATPDGDKARMRAFMGEFQGFDNYKSNQTRATGTWTPANNPTAGATISFGGVTVQFVSTIGTTPGNVLIGASTANTIDNIVTLFAAPATTTATGVAYGTALARKIAPNFTVTDGTTKLDVICNGVGTLRGLTSEPLDLWSLQKQHLIFGTKGFTSLIVQENTENEIKDAPLQNAKRFMSTILYGVKSFADQTIKMVRVEVDSSSF